MKKLLLDTNIYGKIAKEKQPYDVLKKIQLQNRFLFYGIRGVVRKEIRETPKNIKILSGKSPRMLLLNLYDSIIGKHELNLDERLWFIAKRYDDAYTEFGGGVSKDNILNDFLIIACASVNRMDVVVSDDSHTMLSRNAVKSYTLINKTLGLRTPEFIGYSTLKRWFSL